MRTFFTNSRLPSPVSRTRFARTRTCVCQLVGVRCDSGSRCRRLSRAAGTNGRSQPNGKLIAAMDMAGETTLSLAAKLKVHRITVTKWRRGLSRPASARRCRQLAACLGTTIEALDLNTTPNMEN